MEPYRASVYIEQINMWNASSDNQEMEKSSGYDYEVFLSFRGPDTRKDITDYLYTRMKGAGIRVYKDDEDLRPGDEIGVELLKAIEQSKVLIPIFSKGYADSTWCLRELVKMVESKKTRRQTIMPIFYDVAPSEVRYQKACYGKAIASHLNKKWFDNETIDEWKDALSEVGGLNGWDLHGNPDQGKGEFVEEVFHAVLTKLKTGFEESDDLVEMDDHVDEIMRMIGALNHETKIVGIHGIPGVGKTTLAKIVFNRLLNNFDDSCFLSDIGQKEITSLQKQLLSTILKAQWPEIYNIEEGKMQIKERLRFKTVLLLLDDVDNASQLDALVQKREWFGRGTKIIITTKDRGILKVPTLADEAYELTSMDWDRSLQLFSKHAFRRDYPSTEYASKSEKAVKICGGLPLALEVIGSFLAEKGVNEWDAILRELEESPHEDVDKKLMKSVEALNEDQRRIFLDIACCFIGYDQRLGSYMWESCGFRPHLSLGVLQQRSLIKIREDNQLWMHGLLRDIGRNYILQQSGRRPEKQRLIWTYSQASEVLDKMQIGGDRLNEDIEAMRLKIDEPSHYSLIKECLPWLVDLRFLIVKSNYFERSNQVGCFTQTKCRPLNLPQLRWLIWRDFHMCFENFSLKKLVILDLSMSEITEEWNGWSHIKLAVDLKVLNLSCCSKLRKTPDLSSNVNLEWLILESCGELRQIDPSIGHLKKLICLDLRHCNKLRELPKEMGALESLTELLLDYISIQEIPEWRRMKKLEILSLKGCESLKKFSFIGCAASAEELSSVDSPLTRLPKSTENVSSLIELDLSESSVGELPDSIGNFKNLKVLNLSGSSVRRLPNSIGMLEKLERLEVGSPNLEKKNDLEEIPDNIGKLPVLRILRLAPITTSTLPQLPESLMELRCSSFSMAKLPDLSNLLNLRELNLNLVGEFSELEDATRGCCIGRLPMLESLTLSGCSSVTLLSDITHLSRLKRLSLFCHHLRLLPRLPTSLRWLAICSKLSSETVIDISNLKALSFLHIGYCGKLTEIRGLEDLENLIILELRLLPSLAKLPDLTKLKKLTEIELHRCPRLGEIQSLLESLEELRIEHCLNQQELFDPSRFNHQKVQRGPAGYSILPRVESAPVRRICRGCGNPIERIPRYKPRLLPKRLQ